MTVGEALRALTGRRWRLSYELREELDAGSEGGRRELHEEDWMARFMDEFDAEELPRRAACPRRAPSGRASAMAQRRLMPKQPRMPNMQQMMQQVQKMQKDMELAQEQLKSEIVRGSAGGGHGDGEGARRPGGAGGEDRPLGGGPARTWRSSPTWCSRRSTRRCAWPRSWRRARWAAPRPGSTWAALGGLGLPGL